MLSLISILISVILWQESNVKNPQPCWRRGVGCCWKAPAAPAECDRTAPTHPSHKEPLLVDEPEPWWPASQWCSSPPGGGPVFQGCPPPSATQISRTLLNYSNLNTSNKNNPEGRKLPFWVLKDPWVHNPTKNIIKKSWIQSKDAVL